MGATQAARTEAAAHNEDPTRAIFATPQLQILDQHGVSSSAAEGGGCQESAEGGCPESAEGAVGSGEFISELLAQGKGSLQGPRGEALPDFADAAGVVKQTETYGVEEVPKGLFPGGLRH